MNVLELREYFLRKIHIVFGLIEYECRPHFCRFEGMGQYIQFFHPKDENLKICLYLYNKNNIWVFTTKCGLTVYDGQAIYKTEKKLEELLNI
jgi:hypothetical protein